MNKKVLAIVLIVLGVVLVGALALMNRDDDNGDEGERGTVITYRDSGFSPPVLRVASGTTITVRNESSRNLEFSSDPHPSHTGNPQLNADVIAPGESTTLTLASKGNWGYHDHLNPGATGRVIVE